MAAPQSTPLPPAPVRNEPEAVFIPKSNAFLGALEPLRVDLQAQADYVNTEITGLAQAVTDAQTAATAAGVSETNAAASESTVAADALTASNAATSSVNAKNASVSSANDASLSASDSANAAGAAQQANINANNSRIAAENSATASAASELASSNSATTSANSEAQSTLKANESANSAAASAASSVDSQNSADYAELKAAQALAIKDSIVLPPETGEKLSFDSLTTAIATISSNPTLYPDDTSITTASYRSSAECTTLGIAYPDGGGNAYSVGAGRSVDGGSVINAGTKQLHATMSKPTPEMFGATPSIDASLEFQNLTNYCTANKIRVVEVNDNFTCSIDVIGRGEVIWSGSGTITGEGFYRRYVAPIAGTNPPIDWASDLVPDTHLKNLLSSSSPTVVLTGSSTGTLSPDALGYSGTLYNKLINRLNSDVDGEITVHNRAIGGSQYYNLDTTPINSPYWDTVPGTPWLDYIEALAPDAVFIVMGSNDSVNMSQLRLKSVYDKISAWAKPCDIVFITQPAPSLSAPYSDYIFTKRAAQEGRDYSAGLIRSFAKYNDVGLIDSNRLAGVLVDGRDILQTSMVTRTKNVRINGALFEGVDECNDFVARLAFEGDLAAIDAAFTAAGNPSNPPRIKVGSGSSDAIYIKKSTQGFLLLQLYSQNALGGGSLYKEILTETVFPSSNFEIEIGVTGTTAYVEIIADGSVRESFSILKFGGVYLPDFRFFGLNSSPWAVVKQFSTGNFLLSPPQMLASEMWGVGDLTTNQKEPYGGNGINHMTSIGNRLIWDGLLQIGAFRGSVVALNSGVYTPIVTTVVSVADSAAGGSAHFSKVGSVTTVFGSFSMTNATAGLAKVEITLPDILTSNVLLARLAGVISSPDASGYIWANADTPSKAFASFRTTLTGTNNYRFSLSYFE